MCKSGYAAEVKYVVLIANEGIREKLDMFAAHVVRKETLTDVLL